MVVNGKSKEMTTRDFPKEYMNYKGKTWHNQTRVTYTKNSRG